MRVEPEPVYALTFYDSTNELRSNSNYFRELDELNQARYLERMIYLSNERTAPAEVNEINSLFAEIDNYTALIATNSKRPIDYFGRAMNYITLKDYDNAIADLDKAIDLNDKFTVAYMARAYAKQCRMERDERVNQMEQRDDKDKEGSGMLLQQSRQVGLTEILSDYDKVLQLNPGLIYAWYNKGNIMLSIGDLTSALQCYSEAIRISPTFGQAYYNRGLVYLQLGNKASGVADLSKAGELGVLPSYKVLKRMQKSRVDIVTKNPHPYQDVDFYLSECCQYYQSESLMPQIDLKLQYLQFLSSLLLSVCLNGISGLKISAIFSLISFRNFSLKLEPSAFTTSR